MVKKRQKRATIMGYIFLIIVSIQYSFVNTNMEFKGVLSTIIAVVEIIMFLAFLGMTSKFSKKIFKIIGVLLVIAIGTYSMTKETVFLIMLMVAIICSELSYKKIFKLLFFERLALLFLILTLALIGVLPKNPITIIKGGTSSSVTGYGLGFNHPNQLAYNVGLIMLLYMCYLNKKLKQWNVGVIMLIGIIGYVITKTRTLLAISIILGLLLEYYLLVNKKENRHISIVWKISTLSLLICAIAALGLPILMASASGQIKTMLYTLNGLIGSRFTHSARVFELYSIPLFGGITDFNLLQINFGYSVVDNGYLCLLYNFGIVGFLIFCFLYFISNRILLRKKEYVFLIAIITISLWAITENILRSFAINFTVVFWSECLNYFNNTKIRRKYRIKLK